MNHGTSTILTFIDCKHSRIFRLELREGPVGLNLSGRYIYFVYRLEKEEKSAAWPWLTDIWIELIWTNASFAWLKTIQNIGPSPTEKMLNPMHLTHVLSFFKMSASSKCSFCGQLSQLRCGNCREVSYCCKNHQKLDWVNHKPNCPSYKIATNEKLGRHLIASRAISEGEIIIKESPIVCGPPQVIPPICLGCYTLLNEFTARDCSRCGWPICSEMCERSTDHRAECDITFQYKKSKVKIKTFEKGLPHPSYQCLTVLRCLYLKKAQPTLWKKLMNLESHCEERKATIKHKSDQIFISNFIPKFFNFFDFSEEEILEVAGIVQVNAHEVPLTDPGYIAIYEKASLLEHNCRANCTKSFTNSGDLVIRASSKISQGDHLSICYTDPLWGRDMRKSHLLETKFFLCQCPRCIDPTEVGTHFDSIKCFTKKCTGYCAPITKPPSMWKCDTCKETYSEETVRNLALDKVEEGLHQLNKKSVESCREFINKYESVLHPNHHHLVGVKLALIDLFGWPDQLVSLEDQHVEWTAKTCMEMYNLSTSLIPAENRLRGVLLYQLQFAMMEWRRRKATRLESDACQQEKSFLECKNILSKACQLLSYEPEELPEGKMALEARRVLTKMEEHLKN